MTHYEMHKNRNFKKAIVRCIIAIYSTCTRALVDSHLFQLFKRNLNSELPTAFDLPKKI